MTRDPDRANDLVQDTTLKALRGRASFRAGTNFGAWINRIQRNEFISGLRRARPTVTLDPEDTALPSHRPRREVGLVMRWLTQPGARIGRAEPGWASPVGSAGRWTSWAAAARSARRVATSQRRVLSLSRHHTSIRSGRS